MELPDADGATVVAADAVAVAADAAVVDTDVDDADAAVADASCLCQLHMGTGDHIFIIGIKFIKMSVFHNLPASHTGYFNLPAALPRTCQTEVGSSELLGTMSFRWPPVSVSSSSCEPGEGN